MDLNQEVQHCTEAVENGEKSVNEAFHQIKAFQQKQREDNQ